MPFLAPLAPFVGPLIGIGGSVAAAKIGGKGGKKTKQQIAGLTAQQEEASEFALGEAKTTLPKALSALEGPLAFWQNLLGGDRQEMLSLLAPEVNTIISQYDTARKGIANLAPRGGGRTTQLAESRFEEANQISRLLQESRRRAAGEVAGIGGRLGALGLGELGSATGTAASTIQSLLTKRGQDIGSASQLGEGIGGILAQIIGLLPKKFGGGAG